MVVVPAQAFVASGRRAWLPALGGAVVAAAGAWLLAATRETRVGWASLVSGGVLVAWFASPWWRRAPVLWFDDGGVHSRVPGLATVAWGDLAAVALTRTGRRTFLALERTPAARARAPLPRLARLVARSARASDAAVPLDGLAVAPERIAAVVELALRHARAVGAAGGTSVGAADGGAPRTTTAVEEPSLARSRPRS